VSEGGVHEAAVTAGGAEGDALALEQDDLPAWILLLGEQGGPEAGEAAADDDEVGLAVSSRGSPGSGAPGWASQKERGSASA
jgi:hypothetical protein